MSRGRPFRVPPKVRRPRPSLSWPRGCHRAPSPAGALRKTTRPTKAVTSSLHHHFLGIRAGPASGRVQTPGRSFGASCHRPVLSPQCDTCTSPGTLQSSSHRPSEHQGRGTTGRLEATQPWRAPGTRVPAPQRHWSPGSSSSPHRPWSCGPPRFGGRALLVCPHLAASFHRDKDVTASIPATPRLPAHSSLRGQGQVQLSWSSVVLSRLLQAGAPAPDARTPHQEL